MRKLRLAVVALGIALGFTAQTAHATTPAPPVKVYTYLANAHRNPATVTTTCGEQGPVVHTAVYNDHTGATGPEIVQIYKEVGGGTNYENWPVVAGPFTIPLGSSHTVDLPYGPSYNAVAIPAGNDTKGHPYTFPKSLTDFSTMASAGTADNSQLFPPATAGQDNYQYPTLPFGCKLPPPPNPCATHPQNNDAVTVPTCPPTSTKPTPNCDQGDKTEQCPCPPTTPPTTTTKPPVKLAPASKTTTCPPPTTNPPTTGSTTTMTSSPPTTTVSTTLPPTTTVSGSESADGSVPALPASTTPSGPTLAHTGASVVPLTATALVALAAGVWMVLYVRRSARSH